MKIYITDFWKGYVVKIIFLIISISSHLFAIIQTLPLFGHDGTRYGHQLRKCERKALSEAAFSHMQGKPTIKILYH